ncbi:MAG: D-alanyl-D-alanine carboxypeptidase/D-alanyl-D-alanine endopeptidase [bacterium]
MKRNAGVKHKKSAYLHLHKNMVSIFLFGLLSLDTILNIPELANSHYGILIYDLDNDSVVYEMNSQKLFVPASNMKIITTATAFYFLEPHFKFKTYLLLRGQIRKSKLFGDIIIVGRGDPTFSLENLEQFVKKIKDQQIGEITGSILIVDDYFTDERLPVGWSWHYLDAQYAPEISALSFNKNVVSVRIRPSQVGENANVSIFPPTSYVKLVNHMKTTTTNDSIIIFRRPEANIIYVDGAINIRSARNINVAVKDPALFAGEYLRERLLAEGIKISKNVARRKESELFTDEDTTIIIDSIVSPSLFEIVKEINTESENLYAEVLLKTLGAHLYKEGSFSAGIKALKEFLYICSVDTNNVSLWDGSGLSKYNLVSPSALVSVLRFMYNNSKLGIYFYNTLPKPGNGTLKARFNGFTDTLRAKTGLIQASVCLSGFLKINNTNYAFSMLFNNFTCSAKRIASIQEKIINAFTNEMRKDDKGNTKSKYLQEVIHQ